jgi:FG-GAP repeat/Cadherin-like domain/Putative Ig domain
MMSFSFPSSWMAQVRHSRLAAKRRQLSVFLRLEELETRTTPSLTVVPQQFSTNQYTALNITQSQLLAGDTGSATLTASNPTQPANATLVDNHNGTFTFTPDAGFTGSTTFQYTVSATGQSQLTAADGFGEFGTAVAIDNDTVAIGAPDATVNGNMSQGAVYVFVLSGNTWTQQAELTANDGVANDSFGESLALSGDTLIVGTPVHPASVQTLSGSIEEPVDGPGAAYVFVRSGTTWTQQAELTAADGAAGDFFGVRVAISGDTAVVASNKQNTNGQPATYVFERSGTAWSQQAELPVSGAVAISGDTAVIGGDIYVRQGSTWSEQAQLLANGAAIFAFDAVAIDGDTIAVGQANQVVNNQLNQGAVFVFVRSGTTWTQQAELTAADGAAGDSFGSSVSVSGDLIAVGAPDKTPFGGAGYVFAGSGGTWTQQAELMPADVLNNEDNFGMSVSISGDTAVFGAPNQTVNGQAFQGTATVRDLGTATATATIQVNAATAQLFVSPTSLPNGTQGQVYPSTTFTATGGAGSGYTFQESGILPSGLTFDSATGQLTGIPTQIGTFPGIIIAASDGDGGSGGQTYTLIVNHYGVNGFPVAYPLTIYAPPTSQSETNANLVAYIGGLYNSILDRNVESSSALSFWETIFTIVQPGSGTNPLNLDSPAPTDPYQYVADGIWQSQEHRWDEVETYYQDFLGRTLNLNNAYNLSERQYWTNQFVYNQATEEDVIRGFLTSPEYLYDHRADAALANALNMNLLSGSATSADLQTWNSDLSALDAQRASIQNQTFATPEDYKAQLSASNLDALDNETAQTGVLFDMLRSSEYQQAALDSFYQAFLRRAGTPAEEQALLSQKDANGNPLSLGAIAEIMLASPEYRANAVNSEV